MNVDEGKKSNIMLLVVVALAITGLFFLQGPPLGYVAFNGGIANNTLFDSNEVSLYCVGSANTSLENISLILDNQGINQTNTSLVSGILNTSSFSYTLDNGEYQY